MSDHKPEESPNAARQHWMSVLAKAKTEEIVEAWGEIGQRPKYAAIRNPELGLVLVRGRMGGAGDAFNLGEMTVTRAAIRLESGEIGLSYVAGRNRGHAEIAAIVDAMMQSAEYRPLVEETVIARLAALQSARRELAARKAAATRVDFLTMVRDRGPV